MIRLLMFICLLFTSSISSASNSQGYSIDDLESFIKNIESEQEGVQGGAIAIIINEKIVYKKSFGFKDIGRTLPIDDDTLFALASISKPIISTAIGLMVLQGQVSFNDIVKLTFLKSNMSISNFLSHTTGYQFTGNALVESGINKTELINQIKQQEANCKPGKCYKYSNLMYSFIDDALKERGYSITDAISLLNSKLGTNGITLLPIDPNSNFARQYSRGGKQLPFPSNYQKSVPAAAGVFATINSLTEFLKLAMGTRPDLITETVLNEIFRPRVENKDVFYWNIGLPFNNNRIKSWYGLGWRILFLDNKEESRLIFHSGFINGATTFMGFIPSKKAGIIILTNQTSAFALRNGLKFWEYILSDLNTEHITRQQSNP